MLLNLTKKFVAVTLEIGYFSLRTGDQKRRLRRVRRLISTVSHCSFGVRLRSRGVSDIGARDVIARVTVVPDINERALNSRVA